MDSSRDGARIDPFRMKWWPIALAWSWILDRDESQIADLLQPGRELGALITRRKDEFERTADQLVYVIRNGLVRAKGLLSRGRRELTHETDPGEWAKPYEFHLNVGIGMTVTFSTRTSNDRRLEEVRVAVADVLACWPASQHARSPSPSQPTRTRKRTPSSSEAVAAAFRELYADRPPPIHLKTIIVELQRYFREQGQRPPRESTIRRALKEHKLWPIDRSSKGRH